MNARAEQSRELIAAAAADGYDFDNEQERALAALKMRRAGRTWSEIATACGYYDLVEAEAVVRQEITAAAATLSEQARTELLTLEVGQIEDVRRMAHVDLYDEDPATRHKAADTILKTHDKMVRMFALEPKDPTSGGAVKFVVLQGGANPPLTDEELAEGLRAQTLRAAIAAGRTIPHDIDDPPEPGDPDYSPFVS